MSFRNLVSKYLNNHAETLDKHWDENLRTNYYKISQNKAIDSVELILKETKKYQINSISKEYGELGVNVKKGKKAFIVISIIMVRPNHTAIDISVTTESFLPFDFGYSSTLIQELYELFNEKFLLINNK